MKNPLVSILIPAYNAEEWIADTLRSAIAQSWARKEIIVVDDGSSDSTAAVARRFEGDGVHVFTQENQGAAAARNSAFARCQGDYIQWLDADDLLHPEKIASQVQLLDSVPSSRTLLSGGFGKFMYRSRQARFVPTALWSDLSPAEWLIRKMGQNLYMQTATWLVSREVTEAAGPWDVNLWTDDDGEYFCRVLLKCDGIRFVSDSKVYYRALGYDSVSKIGRSPKKVEALWRSMRLHVSYLRTLEDSPRSREASVGYLQRRMIYFYPERPDIVREAQKLAAELGGALVPPHLSWKYAWIKTLLGWTAADAISNTGGKTKAFAKGRVDKALYYLQENNMGKARQSTTIESQNSLSRPSSIP